MISKTTATLVLLLAAAPAFGQALTVREADAKPDKEIVAEQYLLIGDATRGSGESQVAINPLNPNEIAVAAMGVLNQNDGKFEHNELEFQRTPRATLTRFAVTRDRGLTWTIFEDPMRDYYHRYRCLDPFAAFTPTGTMILGCEAHFPTNLGDAEQIDAVNGERRVYGGSTIIRSTDGGRTFSPPVQVISSYMPKELYGPFVSFADTGTTGDAPKIKIDASNGKIYIDGNSTATMPPHSQAVVRMSSDGGRDWGMVYAFDAADWPGSGATYDVANGIMGAAYVATQVPASLNVKCPCRVFASSTDDGKTFERHIIPAPVSAAVGGPSNGMFVAADPTTAGRFTVLVSTPDHVDAYLTEDSGKDLVLTQAVRARCLAQALKTPPPNTAATASSASPGWSCIPIRTTLVRPVKALRAVAAVPSMSSPRPRRALRNGRPFRATEARRGRRPSRSAALPRPAFHAAAETPATVRTSPASRWIMTSSI